MDGNIFYEGQEVYIDLIVLSKITHMNIAHTFNGDDSSHKSTDASSQLSAPKMSDDEDEMRLVNDDVGGDGSRNDLNG